MRELFLDTETYSTVPIEHGTYAYAEQAEVMLIQWALDDSQVAYWDYSTGAAPPDIAGFVASNPDVVVVAANAPFDRTVLRLGNLKQDIPIERWECTAAQARAHALPGSMGDQGRVLGMPQDKQKDKAGRSLIQRFCKPAPSNHKADRYGPWSHPAEWQQFIDYGVQDVVTLREIRHRLPVWNWQPEDIQQWYLDQRINDRGMPIEVALAQAGKKQAIREKARLATRFAELTDGLAPTQRAKIQDFINARYGLSLTSTAGEVTKPLLNDDDTPDSLKEIIRLLLASNKTSTAKYGTLLNALSEDGRFRGGLVFNGAPRTRRWAGKVFQGQNLPSYGLPAQDLIDLYTEALKAGCPETVCGGEAMRYGVAAIRSLIAV